MTPTSDQSSLGGYAWNHADFISGGAINTNAGDRRTSLLSFPPQARSGRAATARLAKPTWFANFVGSAIPISLAIDTTTDLTATALAMLQISLLGRVLPTFYVTATDSAQTPTRAPDRAPSALTPAPLRPRSTPAPRGANDQTPSFGFSSASADASFQFRFDAAAFGPCSGRADSDIAASKPARTSVSVRTIAADRSVRRWSVLPIHRGGPRYRSWWFWDCG